MTTSPGFAADDPAELERWQSELHAARNSVERKKTPYTKDDLEHLSSIVVVSLVSVSLVSPARLETTPVLSFFVFDW